MVPLPPLMWHLCAGKFRRVARGRQKHNRLRQTQRLRPQKNPQKYPTLQNKQISVIKTRRRYADDHLFTTRKSYHSEDYVEYRMNDSQDKRPRVGVAPQAPKPIIDRGPSGSLTSPFGGPRNPRNFTSTFEKITRSLIVSIYISLNLASA